MDKDAIESLIKCSRDAMTKAYCPYSRFPVGAAILADDDTVYTGCNIENAAYTVGICAERTAAAKAISEGKLRFKAIAIACNIDKQFIGPCGACRQFLAEFGTDLTLYLTKPDGSYETVTLQQLLPMAFTPDSLSGAVVGK